MSNSSSLIVEYRVFYTQKRGNELRHYEDAFALDGVAPPNIEEVSEFLKLEGAVDPQGELWRCAVADGATQGGFSKLWAQMLVDHFIYHDKSARGYPALSHGLHEVDPWLKQLSQRWNTDTIEKILNTVPANSPRRSRMQQTLLLEGQAATLAMLELDLQALTWNAGIIGDSLVFHYRGDANGNGQILPVRPGAALTWDQLDTNPILISSKDTNQDAWVWNNSNYPRAHMSVERERFEPGDAFLVMTDAIGKWFLHAIGSGDDAIAVDALHRLFTMETNAEFVAWVEASRSLPQDDINRIGNDDTTLALIRPTAAQSGMAVHSVQPIPVREVPEPRTPAQPPAVTQPAAAQPAAVTLQAPAAEDTVPSKSVQPESAPTVVHQPVVDVQEGGEDEQDDEQYASNRALTRPAPTASKVSSDFNQVMNTMDTVAHANPVPVPSQQAPTTLPGSQTQPPRTNEPAFQSIEAQFDDPPHVVTGRWAEEMLEQVLFSNVDEKVLYASVQQEYPKHAAIVAEWMRDRSSRMRERANCIHDFANGNIDLKQFKAFILLSNYRSTIRRILHDVNMRERDQKSRIRHSNREIETVGKEYIQQWCDRAPKDRRNEFLKYMGEFMRSGDLKALRKLLH